MKDFEKARKLAKEIRCVANRPIHCFSGYEKPVAISVEYHEFEPATPNQVLAELNKKRTRKRGLDLWKMTVGPHDLPVSIEETLLAQTDYRSDVLFFAPNPKKFRKLRFPQT